MSKRNCQTPVMLSFFCISDHDSGTNLSKVLPFTEKIQPFPEICRPLYHLIRPNRMRSTGRQNEAALLKLQAHYRDTWHAFSVAVRHWQTLQTGHPQSTISCQQAEAAVQAAEGRYRQARNAFADYLLDEVNRQQDTLLVSSR